MSHFSILIAAKYIALMNPFTRTPGEAKNDQIRSTRIRDYRLDGGHGETMGGSPCFLEDPTKTAGNPSTRQTTRFSILIVAMDTTFLTPFTHHPRSERGLWKYDPSLAAIRIWVVDPGKWRATPHDFWTILAKSLPTHRIARKLCFQS